MFWGTLIAFSAVALLVGPAVLVYSFGHAGQR
jgi:hypothetical protein